MEIFIFRVVGWPCRSLGIDIGDVNIVGRETEIRDVYIFGGVVPCGGFGVRHITSGKLILGEVRVGVGLPCGVGLPGGWGFGESYGDAYIIKGWGVLRQTLDMLIL